MPAVLTRVVISLATLSDSLISPLGPWWYQIYDIPFPHLTSISLFIWHLVKYLGDIYNRLNCCTCHINDSRLMTLWKKWPPEARYNWLPILQHFSQKLALVGIVSPLDFLFLRDGNIDMRTGSFLIHITGRTARCVSSPPRGLGTGLAPVSWLVSVVFISWIFTGPRPVDVVGFGSSMETLTLTLVRCQEKTTYAAAAHLEPLVGLRAGVAPVVVV